MKKILDLSSRSVAIGSMLIMAFAFVGCDDSSSASVGPNDEPGVESSSSSSGKVTEPDEVTSSSSEKAKSSSSDPRSEVKQSSSSEKSGKSSSSTDDASLSSVKSESSSSVGDSQSSSSKDPELAEGFLTDNRDGQTYKTVTIGTQTWMAENLNYETSNSYCYRDSVSYCAKYGRLYTWAAAVGRSEDECGYGYECGLPSGDVRGVCPKGWHLPSRTEWEALFTAVGGSSTAGSKLKSQTGWTAYSGITNEDAFGFSALPAGYRGSRGSFYDGGDRAYFWSSTEYYSTSAYNMYLYYNYGSGYLDNNYKYIGFSVRCVKD